MPDLGWGMFQATYTRALTENPKKRDPQLPALISKLVRALLQSVHNPIDPTVPAPPAPRHLDRALPGQHKTVQNNLRSLEKPQNVYFLGGDLHADRRLPGSFLLT